MSDARDVEDDDYAAELKAKLEAALKRRHSFDNSIGVVMSSALEAARDIHIAHSQLRDHAVRINLTRAMHHVLIIAEQCRQEMERTAP